MLLREETAFEFKILWFKRSFIDLYKCFLHIDEHFMVSAGVYFLVEFLDQEYSILLFC